MVVVVRGDVAVAAAALGRPHALGAKTIAAVVAAAWAALLEH